MKKFYLLTKTLLVAVLLCVGASNVWGEIDLDDPSTYAVKEYSMTTGSLAKGDVYTTISRISYYVATSPEEWTGIIAIQDASNGSGNGLWIRTGGLEAYGGGRSIILCGLKTGQKVVMTSTATLTLTSVNSSTFTSSITETTCTFDMTSDGDVMVTIGKNQYLKSLKVYSEKVATPTFTIGSYNYEEGGYAVTPSCATEGAALTYTIGGGSAKACTSGVPFYAKGGKLNITASKDGWASSSLAEGDQWTLNAAPSSSSPETLIPFQKSSDNGDRNIEHVYKSVTIAGGSSGAIAGIVAGDANALKLRTNQSSNTITLNVNSGYTVTRVSIAAKSNNKGDGATIDLTSTTVDGGSNIMASTTTFPISTAASAVTYDTNGTAINAKNNIVFTFDNGSASTKQIQATIKVWYKTPVENAIDDCKTYETSAAFATAIDEESFASVAEVYAFHSAWQIANASESGSTDFSKAILNRTFELHNTNGWTIYGDPATGGSDSDNNGVVEYGEGWSQYYTGWNGRNVSQNIATLPAGTYRLTAKVYSGGGGAPVRLFANGQLSDAENGDDHDPVLIFTVAGTEPSIKIGIGGTGHENDTDNTWGNWWYRVKNFTLTRTAVSKDVTSARWATYCSPYALDFSGVDGLKAYIVKGTVDDTSVLDIEEVTTVPANTGVLLEGNADTYSIPVIASADVVSGNKLVGVTSDTPIAAEAGFVLMNEVAGVGFYQNSNAFTVGANTAYLPAGFASSARSAYFFGGITGVENVEAATAEAAQKDGKFIENGKLVIVKNGKKYNANGALIY